ncbi:sensor histidine kinase [Oribacterium sp. WCC10]|uniref:sensor histidine kinase n=1 Tax=Oribacterium sp. WCC10 TaxID=1855343 RepID=UPI0008E2493E|nr:sensor histidine kinase [Oribacterium sp. WCC10]SFG13911.1 two-component system, CitB family, sensor histidine kinase MalK/two-component system, CitB family, sensor histidine kinase DctS [Oribacterium sp. WCC10]
MKNPFRKVTSLSQILINTFIITAISTLILTTALLYTTMRISVTRLEDTIEEILVSNADILASSDSVKNALINKSCDESLMNFLDSIVITSDTIDIITIADSQSVRIYHIRHNLIGQSFVGDDQADVLKGKSYLSYATGTEGAQRRAFHPVYDDSQNIIGFVMVSTRMSQVGELKDNLLMQYRWLFIAALATSILIPEFIYKMLSSILLGNRPERLVYLYQTQLGLLNTLEEGILSIGKNGDIKLANAAAERILLSSKEELEHRNISSFLSTEDGRSVLDIKKNTKNIASSRTNVLMHIIPLYEGKKQTGLTLILIDKTEAQRQAEQLTGSMHMISALRANRHDFMNKLQVIYGLIQMGTPEKAAAYITEVSEIQHNVEDPILHKIRNVNLAALILGKLQNMLETDINMNISSESDIPRHSAFLSSRELVTIVGNLLENAIEAINMKQGNDARTIDLQITETDEYLMISVSDTGTGIKEEDLEKIYSYGFSTKSEEGRGNGLYITKEIVTRHHGNMDVESDPGEGTTFELFFNETRAGFKKEFQEFNPSENTKVE